MPAVYGDHPIVGKLSSLNGEAKLQDCVVHFRSDNEGETKTMEANTYELCLISPVIRAMICGAFKESKNFNQGAKATLELHNVNPAAFEMMSSLWMGKKIKVSDIWQIVEIAEVADQFGVCSVLEHLESLVLQLLRESPSSCVDLLNVSHVLGLQNLEQRLMVHAMEHFEYITQTDLILKMSEDHLCTLLQSDNLVVGQEELAFKALCRWLKECGAETGYERRKELISKLRYMHLHQDFRMNQFLEGVLEDHTTMLMRKFLDEASALHTWINTHGTADGFPRQLIDEDGLRPRSSFGVEWSGATKKPGKELDGHSKRVTALVVWGRYVLSGSSDHTVRVWDKAALACEHTFSVGFSVSSLAVFGDVLAVGGFQGEMAVWDLTQYTKQQEWKAHVSGVTSLIFHGTSLLSGSYDRSIKVWAVGIDGQYEEERTMAGHTEGVTCLASWGGRVASGSRDGTVRVWDPASGAAIATLEGHNGVVKGLAVRGKQLFSVAEDDTVREWSPETWCAADSVKICEGGSGRLPSCLLMDGARVVVGTTGCEPAGEAGANERGHELRVLSAATLGQEQVVAGSPYGHVWALVKVGNTR
eukprot:CAMPEP_0113705460 /NCGR_PEP_ID=MMETSP0038_2-20120614/27145_1 /TAXON_ID=2898 /ORGANISM="Cryptomonas paramecium" /LENGTH=587 /DNA_ID=CAMNT_0000630471 /DNA_START=191 /DNA_END=1950 /DNA_ORIENTATION=- /assembly_acc=CAM_ASM_000170